MTEEPIDVPAFELHLEPDLHRATRGSGHCIELGGKVQLWKLLTALAKRYDRRFRTFDLIAEVWGDYPVEEGTLWAAISELRKLLRPLGLTIEHKKVIGYRLEDL